MTGAAEGGGWDANMKREAGSSICSDLLVGTGLQTEIRWIIWELRGK